MNWKITSLLFLIACSSPPVGMTVSAQEAVETTDTPVTEVETEVVAVEDPVVEPLVDPVVTGPQAEAVASQELLIIQQQVQVQELEDDLMSLYVSVLQKKCIEAGGVEESCRAEALDEAGQVYQEAEAEAEAAAEKSVY